MCTSVPNQTLQLQNYSSLWLHIRKTELVILYLYVNRAAALTGQLSGFITWVKVITSECKSVHCNTHKEMLGSWKISLKLKCIFQDVIKFINHGPGIQFSGTNACLVSTKSCIWFPAYPPKNLSTAWKHMPLIHVCLQNYVERWRAYIFSYTQKWNGFLRAPLLQFPF